jgi:hypothetical protein
VIALCSRKRGKDQACTGKIGEARKGREGKEKTRKKRIGQLSKAENSVERKVKRILLKLFKNEFL